MAVNFTERFPLWIELWIASICTLDGVDLGARATDISDAAVVVKKK